jgi:hypothetical protein
MDSEQYRFSPRPYSALARTRIALLGLWTGALLAFGALFVPAAFAHLPTQLAAAVLGDGFAALNRWGIALGAVCVALGLADRRLVADHDAAGLIRAWLPLAGVLAHATSAIWVAPELHALRVAAGGAIGRLPAGDPELAQFGALHAVSRALFALATGSAGLASIWDLWRLAPKPSPGASPDAGTS